MVVTAVRIWHRMCHSGASFCRSTGPSKDPIELSEEIPGEIEQIATVEEGLWTLYFDESSTAKEEGGVGIVLKSPKGESTSLSLNFKFPCSNNSSEYEALAIGLSIVKEMKIKKWKVVGDSNLVVRQTDGAFALKEISLAPYQSLASSFPIGCTVLSSILKFNNYAAFHLHNHM